MNDYKDITGYGWSVMLQQHPERSPHCDWDKLNGDDWVRVLERHPELSEHCTQWEKFVGWDWGRLLRHHPEFAEHCDWTRLNKHNWIDLLQDQPQLVDTEHLQVMAVSKSSRAFRYLIDPTEQVRRLHHMKWVL